MNAINNPRRILDRRSLVTEINSIFRGEPFEPPMRQDLLSQLKVAYQTGFNEVLRRFKNNDKSLDVLAGNSLLVDQLVRVIFDNGNIFEGNMTPDGKINGWGVHYFGSETVMIGWRKDGLWEGNYQEYDTTNKEWTLNPNSGFYKMNEKKDGLNKSWEITDM